jgi:uncharacterized membrane protein
MVIMLRKSELLFFGIALLAFALGTYAYGILPEQVASHWNIDGQVNGYLPKFWGAFLVPALMLFMAALFTAVPRIDPRAANIKKFRSQYENFVALLLTFMFIIYAQTLLWSLGMPIRVDFTIPAGLGALLFYLGSVLKDVRPNYFIGIRTPWTLASDRVWERTHEMGGKLFKIAGILCLAGALIGGRVAFVMVMGSVVGAAIISIAYSYLEFRKEKGAKKKSRKK